MDPEYFTISLCYNDPWIIDKSLERYYASKSPYMRPRHFLVDQHWPIDYRSFRGNLDAIARKYGCTVLDPGSNMGLARGFNWAVEQLAQVMPKDTFIVGYDPDSFPVTHGWDWAIAEVMHRRPDVGWVSLMHAHALAELYERKKGLPSEFVNGIQITEINQACMNSVCGMRGKFLTDFGVHEENLRYGGMEVHTYPRVIKAGYKWVFLNNYKEDSDHFAGLVNKRYVEWKWRHAHTRDWPGDFESFLQKLYPNEVS